ncbi:MAG TPA: hypothetical protein IGS52_17340 [Oscillatoriaceae cyanobacterium M33_DOE_052]|uniref:Uncharacterized protein n=1 Tax=Planktothricoides sp. SpSt-374 TaxID=2282167 RepID=A0A7C3ZYY2_9CYAN|nr:hypothetical protein [Oscillatoriaceae cyanobacterium M33_DOE_052]
MFFINFLRPPVRPPLNSPVAPAPIELARKPVPSDPANSHRQQKLVAKWLVDEHGKLYCQWNIET